MSEQKPTFLQRSKASLKVWGAKILKWLVFAFGFTVIIFLRALTAVVMLFVSVLASVTLIVIGSRRTSIMLDYISGILKKFPI